MENQFVIPLEILQRIESWLITDIGYDRPMFEEEFAEITYRLDSEEESELYLNLTYEDEPELKGNIYEDAFTIGKNLVIPIYPISKDPLKISKELLIINVGELKDIWNKHIKSPSGQDKDVYYALLILSAIYWKHKATKGFFGLAPGSDFEVLSSSEKREEMLRLYILFNEENKNNKKTIEVRYKNKSEALRNQDGWFTDMMNQYFSKHLIVEDVEDAKIQLSDFDVNYTTSKGRKADITYNSLLISTYNLIKRSSLVSTKGLSNDEAEFIIEYLEYLKIDKDSGIEELRAYINYLLKNKNVIQWYNSYFSPKEDIQP
ncbi:hypothetical protein [Bacteroides sp. 51]|uniref:hypothetical protein n=1 Tax=Bacteroides sp. 51 TaxID=2302938 RepID=UPI0013D272D7|nr:hypothetical protein [Bacteroides sp. 51]NDV84587.1 hypothetical protein [Bacteroides sp. 51]